MKGDFSRISFDATKHFSQVLLQQGRMAAAGGAIAIHVVGSVAMTLLGIGSMTWLRS